MRIITKICIIRRMKAFKIDIFETDTNKTLFEYFRIDSC